jgi:hypothetical protein
MTPTRRLSGPALVLLIAAVAAPASARPIDAPVQSQSARTSGGVDRADTQVRVVEVPGGGGFDWADAGCGAGVVLAATGLGGALVLSIRRRHGRAATTA